MITSELAGQIGKDFEQLLKNKYSHVFSDNDLNNKDGTHEINNGFVLLLVTALTEDEKEDDPSLKNANVAVGVATNFSVYNCVHCYYMAKELMLSGLKALEQMVSNN